ncbi:MAG: peptidyl-prolyl cis-trans isomerase [Candidatus Aminicenantes bacterium]|nr:MAG: peptidyl-prolyl cis-trans isomerase [Candidatus Aminicenantes bacterium]
MWRVRVSVLIVIVLLGSCKGNKSVQSSADISSLEAKKNFIILRVEDTVYFNADFLRFLKFSLGDEYKTLSVLSLSRLVDDFVKEKLLLAEAWNKEIVLTLAEKKEFLAKHSGGSVFEGEGWPMDDEGTELLFEQLLVEKYTYDLVKDIEVEKEEIQEYYTANKREFLLPERVKVSQILLPNEEKAVEVLENLKDNDPENFKRLARAQSVGVEASRGGEMGIFAIGQLPDEMETAIFALKEGEVSPVLESSYGFHIFRLDSRYEPELMSSDQASASIEVKILSHKVNNHISQHILNLKNSLHWEFYEQNLYFPYQRISYE